MSTLPDELILEIILNADICSLVSLYNTNHRIRHIIKNPNTLNLLSNKYDTYIDDSIYELKKICLYETLVPIYGESKYVEGELLRAVQRIKYRYYNDGDTIKYCNDDIKQSYTKYSNLRYYNKYPLCKPVDFLIKHGFKKSIDIVQEVTKYEEWIDLLENAVVDYVLSKNGNYTILPKGESAIK
ncbi:MAG TPA: F-box protein [Candidatus Saccharimonadales bacterium]|nr:F-box protein [Candidatus Saccharimonadales bacterium]